MDNYIHKNTDQYPVIGFLPVQNQVFYYAPDEKTLVCHCTSKPPGSPEGTKRDPIKITYHLGGSTVRVIPNNHEHNCLIGQACTLATRAQMKGERLANLDAREFEYSVDSESSFFWLETAERAPKKSWEEMSIEELQAERASMLKKEAKRIAKIDAALAAL